MIKIGLKDNLKYPIGLLLLIILCRIDEIIIKKILELDIDRIFCLFIFIPQIFGGLIPTLNDFIKCKKKGDEEIKKKSGIELISRRTVMKIPKVYDSKIKIIILLLFDSYFNFLTLLIGKHSFTHSDTGIITQFVEKRLRGAQIILASILCYLTIRTEIHRHHIFSLIFIFVFLIIIILLELLWIKTKIFTLIIFIFGFFIRAFLDTIEKYLFNVNYANPFRILLYEGIFGTIFYIIYLLIFKETPIKEIKSIIYDGEKIKKLYIILALILYSVFSSLRSLYRIHTVQYFSPMGRALFELLLDPFTVIYKLLIDEKIKDRIKDFWIYFGIIISLLFIMSFFSLVYNEFIILYCCHLDYNTFIEIRERSISYNINYGLIDDEDEESEINNNNEKGSELASKK